eukprot:6208640-Pleurochrysis_carterae.AAC.3
MRNASATPPSSPSLAGPKEDDGIQGVVDDWTRRVELMLCACVLVHAALLGMLYVCSLSSKGGLAREFTAANSLSRLA